MIKKATNFLYVLLPIAFIVLVIFFYFSEKNINFINKSRSQMFSNSTLEINNLPLLKNDTSNIIEYATNFNKKKKYNKFFDLIGK